MAVQRRKTKAQKASAKKKLEEQRQQEEEIKRFDESESSDEEEQAAVVAKKAEQQQKSPSKKKKEESSDSEEEESNSSDDDGSSGSDSSDSEEEGNENSKKGPLFSDENSDWLKAKGKKGLLDDDEDDEEGDEDEQASEHSEADDDLLEIERESRRVDAEMEAEKQEAEDEMRRTITQQTSVYHLPTPEELEKEADRVVPPSEFRSHIDSILEVLADFKDRREQGRSRKEYLDILGHFISELYGYLPELVEYFLSMFGPTEALEFIDASDKSRPLVIRTNTLKVRRKDLAAALIKRGVSLDPLANWSKVGLKIVESPVPIGATPEYLGGHYMLQSAASMCPVLALSPEPNEKVLDMSAAPGGKTSYLAQLMKNTGVLVANDLKKERQKATVANMHRLGVKNVITCTHDGRKLGTVFKNRFDRILLDAPCSGLGVISRDPSVKVQRTIADVNQTAHLQKELLLAAIDALKYKGTTGGVMVYSTCSVSIAENEEVVNYALSKRDIRLVETGLDFGNPGYTRYQQKRFHPSLTLTRRFYPHVHNMDGFYVAKIQKLSDRRPGVTKGQEDNTDDQIDEEEPVETVEEEKKKVDKKNNSKKGTKKGKSDDTEIEEPTKKRALQISVPPKTKKKQRRLNAKVTKPRRLKKSDEM